MADRVISRTLIIISSFVNSSTQTTRARACVASTFFAFVTAALVLTTARLSAQDAVASQANQAEPIRLDRERRELWRQFDSQLDAIIDSSAPADQAMLENWRIHGDPSRLYLFLPSDSDDEGLSRLDSDSGLAQLRRSHADKVYRLAFAAVEVGDGTLGFQMLNEAVAFAPDHVEASEWLQRTGFARKRQPRVRKLRKRHASFGWLPEQYSIVDTGGFQITTNDRLQMAMRLAESLDELEQAWRQLFFETWCDCRRLRALRDGARFPVRVARRKIVLFSTRDEYLRHVSRIEPRAAQTRGYYHAASRTAYFVGGDARSESTWYHEVTHQLFQEASRTRSRQSIADNFWAVEGVAMFMESLQHCRRAVTIGGVEADRLQYARFRALREGFYLPLDQLIPLGQVALQQHPRIGAVYSQSAGLVHWMMTADEGRFQRPFLKYLAAVYDERRESEQGLAERLGASLLDLDAAYLEFLRVNESQLLAIDPGSSVRNLCLGGAEIGDTGLSALNLKQAEWLDLFATRVSDAGTQRLAQASQLTQLSLERTAITDQTIHRLSAPNLRELDLSMTRITDKSLAAIRKFSELHTLWLADTDVTDQGIEQLSQLRKLKRLDLRGTQVTDAGRDRLRSSLPDLTID